MEFNYLNCEIETADSADFMAEPRASSISRGRNPKIGGGRCQSDDPGSPPPGRIHTADDGTTSFDA